MIPESKAKVSSEGDSYRETYFAQYVKELRRSCSANWKPFAYELPQNLAILWGYNSSWKKLEFV